MGIGLLPSRGSLLLLSHFPAEARAVASPFRRAGERGTARLVTGPKTLSQSLWNERPRRRSDIPPSDLPTAHPSPPKSLGSNITSQWPDPPACQAPSTSVLPLRPPSGALTICRPHCPSSASTCELRMDRNPVWTVLAQSLKECPASGVPQ